jgi:xylulokinase
VGALLLGIDIGSSSTKAALCRPDGTVLAEAMATHNVDVPRPGWAEMDADKVWWKNVADLARQLTARVPRGDTVAGVAVSGLGPCVLPVDARGRPLRPAILYGIDTRAARQIRRLERRYGRDALFALNGNRLSSQSVGPKILWLQDEEPKIYREARWFMGAPAYLVFRLSGEVVVDRHSASHHNPLIDIDAMAWSDRFADGIVELDRLPQIRGSDEAVGTVTAAAARETGIPAGTPVTTGNADTMSEAISVGVTEPGDLMLMYGTTAFLLLVVDRRRSQPDVWTTGGCFRGRYGISGGMGTAGALTTWFRNQFGRDYLAGGADPEDAYHRLAEEATTSEIGARGLVALPYFSGERTPLHDPNARGLIAGLSLAHTRGDVYRALLESVAFGVRHNLEAMRATGAPVRRVAAVGGGIQNRLWVQLVSDVASVPQQVQEHTLGAAYGDAFLAGLATGVIADASALHAHWVHTKSTITPNEAATAAYEPFYRIYRHLYPHTRADLHRLARLSRRTEPPDA